MGDKLRCANTDCKWRKKGRCVLFAGVSVLECQYRKPPHDPSGTRTVTDKKKGK